MTPTSAPESPLRLLRRHPNFRHLALGRTLTQCANAMAPVVLAFAVLDMTGSALDVGLVVGARSVATIVLVLFGGVLADRLPRALILTGSSIAAAAVQAVVAVALLTDAESLALLVALSVVNGAAAAVSMPASAALVPQTVPPEEWRPANALTRIGMNTGMIAGASLGGVITAALDTGWGIAATAVGFAAAAIAYHRVRLPRAAARDPDRARSRPLRELREGWAEFTARTWIWVVVLQFFVVNAVTAGGIYVLGPTIADSHYGRTAWGLVLATQMDGALIGGFIAARSRARHALRIGVAVTVLDALPLLVLAEKAPLALLVVAMFVNGIALEQFTVAWDISLQENVPPDRLARVYSFDVLGSTLALPLGEMTAGGLAERFGTRATLLGGVCLVVSVTALALCSRQVRTLTAARPGHPVAAVRPGARRAATGDHRQPGTETAGTAARKDSGA